MWHNLERGETLTSILDHRLVERYKGGCQAEYKGGLKLLLKGRAEYRS